MPVTWETATDWDNAQSEQGVVHDNYGDLPGSDIIQLGYPKEDANGTAKQGHWHFDGGSGPIEDVSGNALDLSVTGNPSFEEPGLLSTTSVSFDGSNDWAKVPHDPALNPSGDMTILCLFLPDIVGGGDQLIAGKGDGSANGSYKLYQHSDDVIAFRLQDDNINWTYLQGTTALSAGTWYLGAGRYDSSASQMDVWLNGSQENSATQDLGDSQGEFAVAVDPGSTGYQSFDGRLDLCMVFDRRLSDTELSNIYQIIDTAQSPNGTLTSGKKTL